MGEPIVSQRIVIFAKEADGSFVARQEVIQPSIVIPVTLAKPGTRPDADRIGEQLKENGIHTISPVNATNET